MIEEKAARLRQAREKAGFANATEAARNFGWGESGYRHHENGTRAFGLDAAAKYARAFKVKAGWLLGMAGVDNGKPTDFVADPELIVGGVVAAGVWREEAEVEDKIAIAVPPIIPNAKRFGYRVEGRSMDEFYAPGTILHCVSIYTNGVRPETGDHVIVRRCMGDLRELTVKEYVERDGEAYLVPRSSQPEFKEMHIGKPDADMFEGDEIAVIAFVVGDIPPHRLHLLERLGQVRKI